MYLTYEEYEHYGGELTESAFILQEFQARKIIDRLTDNRVRDHMETVSDAVKMTMKALIDMNAAVGISAQATNPQATSFSNDGYSETYGNAIKAEDAERRMMQLAKVMLHGERDDRGVLLLYLGVDW